MTCKLVVYDFDGTLVDTAPVVVSLLNQFRRTLEKAPLTFDKVIPWLSLGGLELTSKALEIDNLQLSKEYLEKFRDDYKTLPGDVSPLYSGVRSSLEELYNSNIQLAICTNKPRILVEKIIKALELEKYFSTIVAGDDLPTKKPDPTPLITCAERLGVLSEDTIFVGDSTVDQKTANAANIKFFFFSGGYDDGVDQSTATVFDNHSDIFKLVKHGK